ncbi:MAG: hypothetical protein LBI17_00365 [Rickettsiales bacterium]|jgi:hypothetical protein|nr:hypothetical protein [Rickettsiales bacterium]
MKKIALILAAATLGACSPTSDTLFGESGQPAREAKGGSFDGTFVKNKIAGFRAEEDGIKKAVEGRKETLTSMRNETNQAVTDYRGAVAQINSKLQLGTTPGNPELMDEWRSARGKLERVSNLAFDIKRLTADVESDQSMVEYMVGSIQAAYKIRGATEDDHKQLRALEDEAKSIGQNISIFARQISQEADRQQAYVDGEKYALNDVALNIKNGKLYGAGSSQDFFADGGSMFSSDESYGAFMSENQEAYGYGAPSRGPAQTPRPAARQYPNSVVAAPSTPVLRAADARRPLIAIKVDSQAPFEEPLYQSLQRALERNPAATFEVAGVMPYGTPTADKTLTPKVKKVMNALTEMGLPASRVALTMNMDNVSAEEVRVYEK